MNESSHTAIPYKFKNNLANHQAFYSFYYRPVKLFLYSLVMFPKSNNTN